MESYHYTPENGEMPVIDHSLLKDIPQDITILKLQFGSLMNGTRSLSVPENQKKLTLVFLPRRKSRDLQRKLLYGSEAIFLFQMLVAIGLNHL
jgi:hypothetical protein